MSVKSSSMSGLPAPALVKKGDLSSLSSVQNLLLGLSAGACTKVINYPLLSIKNTVQQGVPISYNPAVVYRGLPMAVINLGGTTALQFLFTGYFQGAITSLRGGQKDHLSTLGGALIGGLLSGIPGSFYELTMIQQQRFGGSLISTPPRVAKTYGVATLARGVTCTMGREGLYTLGMLGLTPVIQRTLVDSYGMDESIGLISGSVIGALFSTTLTHPLDTIKSCMQGDLDRKRYSTVTLTGRQLVAEAGVQRGLFRGLSWRIGLIGTTFFLVNKLKEGLTPVMFGGK